MQLKELSHEAKEVIVLERTKNGRFNSLSDFLDRTGHHIHLQDSRVLIKAGCFDSVSNGTARPGLVWEALRFFNRKEENKTPGLFDATVKKHLSSVDSDEHSLTNGRHHSYLPSPEGRGRGRGISEQTPYPKRLMLKHESETLGFLLSIHPLDLYQETLKGMRYVLAKDLRRHVGRLITITGWLVTGKTVRTKKGDHMKFISFEDTTGIYETVLFPKVYNHYCHILNASRPYILKGKVDEDFGSFNINVQWIGFLDMYRDKSLVDRKPMMISRL